MRRLLCLSIALAAAGCAPDGGPPALPTPADAIPEVTLFGAALAEAPGGVLSLDAPLGATRVAARIVLRDPSAPAPLLQARGRGEVAWRPLEVTWREGAQVVARVDLDALVYGAELRVPPEVAIEELTWTALVPQPDPPELAPAGDVGAARQALRADIAALGVVSRETWGARATRCTSGDGSKYRFAIHHTVSGPGGDPAANLRGIQSYHMDSRGWCDIGYHFLVSIDGRTWEGRPVELLGAHVGGHNTGNIGISFIGCFHGDCGGIPGPYVPPEEMITGGAGLVSGLGAIFGITPSSATVLGHRDHPDQSTSCPGDHLHARLDDLRAGGARSVYGAAYVDQTFPLASQPFELAPNEVSSGYLEMRNTGTEPWRPGETFLGTTEPRDGASPLAAAGWVSPSRAATIDREVAPGETGRFVFDVRAPLAPGDYPQFFNLVQEGVAWFGDPGQGGPPDAQLQIRVTVLDVPPVGGEDAGPPPPPPDAATPAPDGGVASSPDAGPDGMGDGGCSCRAAGSRGGPGASFIAPCAALMVLGLRSRRSRTSTRRSDRR